MWISSFGEVALSRFQVRLTIHHFCGLLDLGIIALKSCPHSCDLALPAFFPRPVFLCFIVIRRKASLLRIYWCLSQAQAVIHLYFPAPLQETASQWQT